MTATTDWLAEQFEQHRLHLRGVSYRMLGSLSEADDAVQETWLRLSRADTSAVENLRAWLTTVAARVCLDMLRTRASRREDHVGVRLPDPLVSLVGSEGAIEPEQEALLAHSIGLALLVALERLAPAERLAFVLHDVFAVSFDEIAPLVGRSPAATRQLASRARRRVRGAQGPAASPEADLTRQWEVVHAFLAAARGGDFSALLAVLDPDVVLRADNGASPTGAAQEIRGAPAVAAQALSFAKFAPFSQPALVNGAAGFYVTRNDRPFAILGFTIADGKIVEINVLSDPTRLGAQRVTG